MRTGHAFLCQMASGGFEEYANAFCYELLKGDREDEVLRRRIREGAHADIQTISGEKGAIKVEQIRQLIEEIAKKPYEGSRRVVCIHYADAMTAQAQNALLKTLEEPPEGSVLLLLTENQYRMLPTIRSRCICKSAERRPVHRGGQTEQEGILELISEDDIQYQENLAHQRAGDKIYEGICAGLRCAQALQKGKRASEAAELLPQTKEEFDAACLMMLCYFSRAMEIAAQSNGTEGIASLADWAGRSPSQAAGCVFIIHKAISMARQNVSAKLVGQWLCINMLEELD